MVLSPLTILSVFLGTRAARRRPSLVSDRSEVRPRGLAASRDKRLCTSTSRYISEKGTIDTWQEKDTERRRAPEEGLVKRLRLDHGSPFWRGRLDGQDLGSWRRVRGLRHLDGGGLGILWYVARLGRMPHGARRFKLDGAHLEERAGVRRWPALVLEAHDLFVEHKNATNQNDDEQQEQDRHDEARRRRIRLVVVLL